MIISFVNQKGGVGKTCRQFEKEKFQGRVY
jgi:hypothetical protein